MRKLLQVASSIFCDSATLRSLTKLVKKAPRRRAKLTAVQLAHRRKKGEALATAIEEKRTGIFGDIEELQDEHHRSNKWIRNQLYLRRNRRRKSSPWNSFLRREWVKFNSDRSDVDQITFTLFLPASPRSAADEEGNREANSCKAKGASSTVKKFCQAEELNWSAMCNETGVEGIFIAVRGSIDDLQSPYTFFTEKVASFIRRVLKMTPERLALKLESYVVSEMDQDDDNDDTKVNRKELVSQCRTLIKDGLNKMLHNMKKLKASLTIKMNYTNYEPKIIIKYGVELVGWPLAEMINPGKIGVAKLIRVLLNSLENESCHWVQLSKEEYTQRKADFTQRAIDAEEEDDDDEEADDDDDDGGQRQKKRKAKPLHRRAPKRQKKVSDEFIDDEDEEDGTAREYPSYTMIEGDLGVLVVVEHGVDEHEGITRSCCCQVFKEIGAGEDARRCSGRRQDTYQDNSRTDATTDAPASKPRIEYIRHGVCNRREGLEKIWSHGAVIVGGGGEHTEIAEERLRIRAPRLLELQ
ncbi:hypothetical protein BDN72DRAFT_966187 [Pluteus cervinus]|uniref:Uncharacterized protein n=1 Tax=Pluteus cervinus TaxID=181527 RepID=A0ACD3A031_9AGAR|nr:hypothetical protein BDN72DRAFT_966187 [Pluteus cervinus]